MPGEVVRPRWARAGFDRQQADELRRRIADLMTEMPWVPHDLGSLMLLLVDQRTAPSRRRTRGRFAIVCTHTNEAVVRWALEHAKRPRVSIRLWMAFQNHLMTSTNEVMMSREAMMEVAGASTSHVSNALSEFVSIHALTRHKHGREVRFRLSTRAATHLAGRAREEAQDAAPPLLAAMREPPS